MYIVICSTSYETWYNEFDSLEAAKAYINDNNHHIFCRLFKIEKELEV